MIPNTTWRRLDKNDGRNFSVFCDSVTATSDAGRRIIETGRIGTWSEIQ